MGKPRKSQRQKNIEHFKQILDANLLAPVPGRDPKVKYFAPTAPNLPNVKLPGIPSLSELAPPPVASTRKTDLAQYLLARTSGAPLKTSIDITGKDGADQEEPGLLSKIFDTMSGAMYGSYQALGSLKAEEDKSFGENLGDTVSGFAKGVGGGIIQTISGLGSLGVPGFAQVEEPIEKLGDKWAPEKFGHQILEEAGVDNKFAKYGLGFVMDIAADPLTYVPGIGFVKGGKKAKTALEGLTEKAAAPNKPGSVRIGDLAPKPKIRQPRITESLTDVGNRFRKPEMPALDLGPAIERAGKRSSVANPVANRGQHAAGTHRPANRAVNPDGSFYPSRVTENILNDPVSMNAMNAMKRSDNARRAANIRHGNPPDMVPAARPQTISEKAEFLEKMAGGKLNARGSVASAKGAIISQKAVGKIIEDIQAGTIARHLTPPEPATGVFRKRAVDIADDFITNNLVKKGRHDMNPASQANLYNKIFNSNVLEAMKNVPSGVKKPQAWVNSAKVAKDLHNQTVSMLRTAEDHLIRLGKHPVYWNGMQVRLSDIMQEFKDVPGLLPTQLMEAFIKRDTSKMAPEVAEAVNRALARRAMNSADLFDNIDSYAVRAIQNIQNTVNPGKARGLLKSLPQNAREVARQMGLTDAEQDAILKRVEHLVDETKIAPERFWDDLNDQLRIAKNEGRLPPDQYGKLLSSLVHAAGETAQKGIQTDLLGLGDGRGAKFANMMAAAFSTNIGRGPMKKTWDSVWGWRQTNADLKAAWFADKAKRFTPEQAASAFRAAAMPEARIVIQDNPELMKFADQIQEYFEYTFGRSGFSDLKSVDNGIATTADRSRFHMEDINHHLKIQGSMFQFTDGVRVTNPVTKTIRNYSKDGLGWKASWEMANPKDVLRLMYDIDQAVEKVVALHSVLDTAAATFGAIKGMKNFDRSVHTYQVAHHVLSDVRFPPEVGKQLDRLLKDIDKGLWRPQGELTRMYGRGLRLWKTGVTIYLPSHHIRNMIGDMHLMWWAGHNDPRNFIKAARIIKANRGKYKGAIKSDSLDNMEALLSKDGMELARTNGSDVIIKQKGISLTVDEMYTAAYQRGLLVDANRYEDIFGESMSLAKDPNIIKERLKHPLNDKASHFARGAAEAREHYIRLAHYVGAVNKGLKKSKDVQKVLDDAANEVRKWHPDGRDLTMTEQKLRYLIPFYSWTRKAFPLIAQAAVQRPAKVLYYPKAQGAFAGMMGIESENYMLDPFPQDSITPDWIRERGIGPIGDAESEDFMSSWWGKLGQNMIGVEGQQTGYTIVNPSNPFQDLISETFGMGDPKGLAQGLFNTVTPAAKIPTELGMDQNALGIPISDYTGYKDYALQQVPIASAINNVLQFDADTMEFKKTDEGGFDWQAFMNYMTAAGIRGTAPFEKGAEIELGQRLRREKK